MAKTYEKAGVNLEAGYEVVRRIKQHVASTSRVGSMGNIGSFGGMFDLSALNVKEPVLVSGTDGVGTKLKIAFAMDKHDTIGGHNVPAKIEAIVAGVAEGCRQAGCALVGGETAEMPGMYSDGEYDIAGYTTGVVEKSKLIDGSKVKAGDVLVGVASTGVHSNGFSLVRKIVADAGLNYEDSIPEFGGKKLGEVLLTPTKIYVSDPPVRCPWHLPHHRRRFRREHPARAARGTGHRDPRGQLGDPPGVPPARAARQHPPPGDVQHLQHGHRDGRRPPACRGGKGDHPPGSGRGKGLGHRSGDG